MIHSMRPTTRCLRVFARLTLVVALVACSDDAGTNATADTGGDDTGGDDTGGNDTGDMTWSAQLYRVDDLVINQPAGLGVIIGELVNRDVQNGLLNILVETGTFEADMGATNFEIRGGAGETTDEGVTFSLVNDVDWVGATVATDGTFQNTELLVLDFPVILALPPDCGQQDCPDDRCRNDSDCTAPYTCDLQGDGQCTQDVVLPLKDIQIDGTFAIDDDGNPVIQLAELEGAILKEDADQLVVGLPGADPVQLTDLLQEERMNYPAEGDLTGWQLSAIINAIAVAAAE